MSVNTLQLYSQQPNGVTYCDPSNPNYIVRFKTTASPKVLDGQRVTNYICEITANDSNIVAVGGANVTDALSVRIRTSGGLQSKDRLAAILNDLVAKVAAWENENVLIGFAPQTAPINTVA